MKRVLGIWIACMVLLAVAVLPAAAGGDNNQYRWDGTPFGLVGQITATDAASGTVTVLVYSGSSSIQPSVGSELTLVTNKDTRFLEFGATYGDELAFSELEVGDIANVLGYISAQDGSVSYIALRITVDFPL